MKKVAKGKVIIAGAGPGDAELITLKAVRYLQCADVVLTDRLVSEEILNAHVSPLAKVVFVGKEGCNNGQSVSQKEINQMLVQYAFQGKLVVRLKGGDVAFFSNVLDELHALLENQIAYEIIPGITAASGASAYAGIPLTARNYSRAVRILTYSKKHPQAKSYWKDLAETDDTLVFYMAGETWYDLAENFLINNVSNDKKIAIVQQATTPFQKVFIHSFESLGESKMDQDFVSPSLVIIGRVVDLHSVFAWQENSDTNENYFRPASRVAVEVLKENKLSA
ncbi:uroporphyrinogen-III C-methyltransferase [Arachidicoccus sp.]|uniref:uroporphyrinogen-III C-methyltransferase n=1 Tax=Arachidicoccus sp. TaxID=1872624 RepID=UPI003D1CE4C4